MGMRAMGRDENILSYLLQLILTMAFNFTIGLSLPPSSPAPPPPPSPAIGMIGAVIGFLWSVVSVIRSYQAPLYSAVIFFGLAALAAVAFAVTWIIGLYLAAAGTVYVGAKVIAANLRIEDAAGRQQRYQRVD
jgi:hypothetical protein